MRPISDEMRTSMLSAAAVFAERGFDGFNLSDIFEYMDEKMTRRVYGELLRAARPGARLVYWNMLVPRSCPPDLRDRITEVEDESRKHFESDRAFFYSAFHVDEVR